MKDWVTLEPDVTVLMNKHYSVGRAGHKVDKIVVHHNDGNLSTQGCWDVWQSRQASAHYQVEADGTIGQLVYDSDTAWHAGNWDANLTSIGIEHANNSRNPYSVSGATLDNGAHLVAAVCVKFSLGEPRWLVNVFPHYHFRSTSCPGSLAGSQHEEYMGRARFWYQQMTGATPTAPTAGSGADIETLARDVLAGKYGNGEARRQALGANYDAVQARVNEILNGKQAPSVDIDALARDVIAGKYGNGAQRRQALGANYQAVQARVNQILGA